MPALDFSYTAGDVKDSFDGDWECWGRFTADFQDYGINPDKEIKIHHFSSIEDLNWTPEATQDSVSKILADCPMDVGFDVKNEELWANDTDLCGVLILWAMRDILYSEYQLNADNLKDLFLAYKKQQVNRPFYYSDSVIQRWTAFTSVESVYNGKFPVKLTEKKMGGELFNYLMGNLPSPFRFRRYKLPIYNSTLHTENMDEHLLNGGAVVQVQDEYVEDYPYFFVTPNGVVRERKTARGWK